MSSARGTVPPDDAGRRIDRVVAALLDEPRARAQARVERGDVTVDGHAVRKSYRVRGGERIVVAEPGGDPRPPPPVPLRFEDEHLAVVAKPAGMVVHAGAGVRSGTLVDALQAMGVPLAPVDDEHRPGIVHRLDRGTSGLLVVAKTPVALLRLRAQFDERSIARRYWALIDGVPERHRATIDAPIARRRGDRTRFWTAEDGRPAVTHYEVEAAWDRASVLAVRLETGRTHQVRVHLAALGHPVCGDLVYGASASLSRELGLERPALHAAHLGFAHPVTGVRVAIDEALPDDLRAALRRLGAAVTTSTGVAGPAGQGGPA